MSGDDVYYRVSGWSAGPARAAAMRAITFYDLVASLLRASATSVIEYLRAEFGAAPDGWDTPGGLNTLKALVRSHHVSVRVAEVLRAETREQLLTGAISEETRALPIVAPMPAPAHIPSPATDLTPLFQEPTT